MNNSTEIPLSSVISSNTGTTTNATNNPATMNNNSSQDNESEKDSADRLNPATSLLPVIPNTEIPEEFNAYRNKKTLTQGLMDIALFSANANQLRYILDHGSTSQAYFYIASSLIILSLILQIAVGLLLLMSTQYNVSVECQREKVYKYGNYVVVGIFLITVVNIFIAAFGGPAVLPTAQPS